MPSDEAVADSRGRYFKPGDGDITVTVHARAENGRSVRVEIAADAFDIDSPDQQQDLATGLWTTSPNMVFRVTCRTDIDPATETFWYVPELLAAEAS